jgi:hypothetical protein
MLPVLHTDVQLLNGEVELKILKQGVFCSKIDFPTWQSEISKLLFLIGRRVVVVNVNEVGLCDD